MASGNLEKRERKRKKRRRNVGTPVCLMGTVWEWHWWEDLRKSTLGLVRCGGGANHHEFQLWPLVRAVEMITQKEERQCRSPSLPDLILPPLLAVASSIRTWWNPALTSLWAAAMPDIPHPMTTISGSALAAMSPRVKQTVPLSRIRSLTQDQCEVIG